MNMKKVFYVSNYDHFNCWTKGKEYELLGDYILTDDDYWFPVADADDMCTYKPHYATHFTRIEREVFEHDGVEFFKHTPGDPMPCDGDALVHLMFQDGTLSTQYRKESNIAGQLDWSAKVGNCNIIGWRYADKVVKPEPAFHDDDNGPDDDIAAMDADWLAEEQKRHWNEMEKRQEAKERERLNQVAQKQEAEIKKSDELNRAMGVVNKFLLGMR